MGDLYKHLRGRNQLHAAWRRIRLNGLASSAPETRAAVRQFEENEYRNLERLQEQLQKGTFRFEPQTGVAVRKTKSSDKRRPLVIAPIENRIIQRAILDTAQQHIPAIKGVLDTPTSIGGIPNRGVGHALALIDSEIRSGAKYYIRSDISGFFTKIPRAKIIEFLKRSCDDEAFIALFESAITTELSNIDSVDIREHRDIFPIGPAGVAQGSPLSPLLGNILLKEFDDQMNQRGIRCIRYIDDFILLGAKRRNVRSAFESARDALAKFDMEVYDPAEDSGKAEEGGIEESFDFLGYQICPGLIMPSKSARQRIDTRIDNIVNDAKRNLREVAANTNDNLPRYRYSHTLKYLNDVIKGWAHAFQFTNSRQCLTEMDKKIDEKLTDLDSFLRSLLKDADPSTRRRLMGVYLLQDMKPRSLPGSPDL